MPCVHYPPVKSAEIFLNKLGRGEVIGGVVVKKVLDTGYSMKGWSKKADTGSDYYSL